MSYEVIPDKIVSLIKGALPEKESSLVLESMSNTIMLETTSPPLVDRGRTEGDWNIINLVGSSDTKSAKSDVRSKDALSTDIIEQMLKSSPVRFALEMKRSQIVSVFRNETSWNIKCTDEDLKEVVRHNLRDILPKMSLDFSFSSLVYGASFQELVWEYKTKAEMGIDADDSKTYVVARIPNSVNPKTVKEIRRTSSGRFDGFIQKSKDPLKQDIAVPVESSLIIPYDERFRNLWGNSLLKPMYPMWYWYEIVMRSMVRYMERTGSPVVVVKAPSRATVIKPGTNERVDGISWGMEIASNVSRSNAVSLPSDTDDDGKAMWDIDYLKTSESSQPFMHILELLTQMILRAGLSADRALSQSSGGVGSYSIGEIHKEATALHNEMILTQWIHYLNTYFLPLFSLYNSGTQGPRIWMETQGLDPTDRQNLTTMLGISQNMESFKDVGYQIDWESLLTINNIPLIPKEEAESLRKQKEEENLKRQEDTLAVQSKFQSPSPTKQPDGSLKANLPTKAPEPKQVDAEEDDVIIELNNPYRDKLGRFASGNSRGARTSAKQQVTGKIEKSPGSIFRTTAKVLGLSGVVGTVGVVALATLSDNDPQISPGQSDDKGDEDNLGVRTVEEVQNDIDKLSKDWPKFSSTDELVNSGSNVMKEFGFDMDQDVSVSVTNNIRSGAAAQYDYTTNTLEILPEIAENVADGAPTPIQVVLHELAHSNQEVPENFEDTGFMKEDWSYENYTSLVEAQNDLATLGIMSNIYGSEMSYDDMEKDTEAYYRLTMERDAINGDNTPKSYITGVGYENEAKVFSRLVHNTAEITGQSRIDVLSNIHNDGFSLERQHDILYEAFPEEMEDGGYYSRTIIGKAAAVFGNTRVGVTRDFPSMAELDRWMDNHGYVSKDLAFEQMMKDFKDGN